MEARTETESKGNGGVGVAWLGVIIAFVGKQTGYFWDYWLFLVMVGIAMAVVGSVLWAQRKNRHWAFGFWGILAPIGFLGISLLKDKSLQEVQKGKEDEKV